MKIDSTKLILVIVKIYFFTKKMIKPRKISTPKAMLETMMISDELFISHASHFNFISSVVIVLPNKSKISILKEYSVLIGSPVMYLVVLNSIG